MKNRSSFVLFLTIMCLGFQLLVVGCGVKGKPMPPLTAPPIGRGQPTMAQPPEDPTATPDPTVQGPKKGGSRDNL